MGEEPGSLGGRLWSATKRRAAEVFVVVGAVVVVLALVTSRFGFILVGLMVVVIGAGLRARVTRGREPDPEPKRRWWCRGSEAS
ncbi:hypothetical protein [Agromyces mangrovi Wang et al. 2018]|uniref:hypothetical protein n=1 Tax=Agromyces mangrovi TaxID=1858653 RepID=UPI0025725EA1|nr:hypothetical protein [Agromyces mangrovi]